MTHPPALRRCAIALGLLAAFPSWAAEPSYFYGGLGVGRSDSQLEADRIATSQLPLGTVLDTLGLDKRDTTYKIFGGYQMTPTWALEFGYFNLGKSNFTANTTPAGPLLGEVRLHGLNLDLVGTLPMSERLALLGRIGVHHTETSDSFSGSGAAVPANASLSSSGSNLKLGLGLQFELTRSFILRTEIERYRVDDATHNHGNVNAITVGLVIPFGRADVARPAPLADTMPISETMPIAPPPPPVVAVAPPVPAPMPAVAPAPPRRVSFTADSLFGFDKSALQPAGREELDKFALELRGVQFDTITVEGHTDRLGSTAYNQTLSQQRADVVKDYLVSSGGVDAARISAIGKSESMPVTAADACPGKRANAALIACLQPDRRVEVVVVGTR